jgi:hypothetical protein
LHQRGIDSIREEFLAAGANDFDAERLNPDRLFRLADTVSVRHDRAFIIDPRHGTGVTWQLSEDGHPLPADIDARQQNEDMVDLSPVSVLWVTDWWDGPLEG